MQNYFVYVSFLILMNENAGDESRILVDMDDTIFDTNFNAIFQNMYSSD